MPMWSCLKIKKLSKDYLKGIYTYNHIHQVIHWRHDMSPV